MVALPDFVLSATLIAVTVTLCGDVTEAGAKYLPPEEMLPMEGAIDQLTAELFVY
jgi:hypothetical protein